MSEHSSKDEALKQITQEKELAHKKIEELTASLEQASTLYNLSYRNCLNFSSFVIQSLQPSIVATYALVVISRPLML